MTDAHLPDAPPSSAPTHRVDPDALEACLEALLLMATEPLGTPELAQATVTPLAEVEAALTALATFYDETGRGFALRNVGGGWRYATRPEYADVIGRHILEGQHGRLSQAALETLAVIAYLQPISRGRIAGIRGVNVDGVVRTLLSRDLIAEAGQEGSGATLFVTTGYFLERLGLAGLDDLPPLAPHLPEATDLAQELARVALTHDGATGPADGGTSTGAPPPNPSASVTGAATWQDGVTEEDHDR